MLGSTTCAPTISSNNKNNNSNNNSEHMIGTGAGVVTSVVAAAVSVNPLPSSATPENNKCEAFAATVALPPPCIDKTHKRTMLEEHATNSNNSANINSTNCKSNIVNSNSEIVTDGSTAASGACGASAITVCGNNAIVLHQSSNSNGTSVSVAAGTASSSSGINAVPVSPTNMSSTSTNSDHSNGSNNNMGTAAKELLQDLSVEAAKNEISVGLHIKEEEAKGSGNVTEKRHQSNNALSNVASVNSVIKEEPGLLSSLIHVKKEENSVSPVMSPVGFGSIDGSGGGTSIDGVRSGTPVKLNEIGTAITVKNKDYLDNKLTNVLKNEDNGGTSSSLKNNNNISNNTPESSGDHAASSTFTTGSIHQQQNAATANAFISNVGSGVGAPLGGGGNNSNCVDYMQQQNHIFVFSTQLANKGAESVLNGQFPTIIAYHCTQPATKNFLEEFFLKNPMKMSKFQRQNTINFSNLSMIAPGGAAGGSGAQWLAGCNNSMLKIATKPSSGIGTGVTTNNKMHFVHGSGSSLGLNLENNGGKSNTPVGVRAAANITGMGGFIDSPVDALTPETELMCWEQSARSGLDGHAVNKAPAPHGLKIVDESLVTTLNSNKLLGSSSTGAICNDVGGTSLDSSIPSLQGVKVPDENLTPQQRQHREEQLAKLKKMNQFLFPENGGVDFRPDNSTAGGNKVGSAVSSAADGLPGQLGLMLNLPGGSTAAAVASTKNSLNSALRAIPGNVLNGNQSSVAPEHMTLGGNADTAAAAMVTSDLLGSHRDLGSSSATLTRNGIGALNKSGDPGINMACGVPSGSSGGLTMSGISVMTCATGGAVGNNLMPNSPEVLAGVASGFNQNCSGSGSTSGALGENVSAKMLSSSGSANLHHGGNMNLSIGGAMPMTEWSKMHQNAVEERLSCINEFGESYARSHLQGVGNVRAGQGPPPPYHQHQQNQHTSITANSTQRSASVPIATQSPNPASPNNPTSNLSLPSPRTTCSGAFGMPAHSPNMDLHSSVGISGAAATSNTTTTASNMSGKSIYVQTQQQGGGESSPNSMGGGNSGNTNNRSRSGLNQFSSNPSTPLSHMSPKDLEPFNGANTGDIKNSRPSPQRSKTPLMTCTPVEQCANSSNMEGNGPLSGPVGSRFPTASPGLNFPVHLPNMPGAGVTMGSGYKPGCNTAGTLERQNSAPILPSQFCRRTDNLPLNPNSGRPGQNKINHDSFDPISSLAQMSQQLTSCVSLNSSVGMGNSPGGSSIVGGPGAGLGGHHHSSASGMIGMLAGNDLNIGANLNSNAMEGMLSSMEHSMDLCNPGGPNNINMPPHMSGGAGASGQFLSNNAHLQSMLGSGIGQRLANPKLCIAPLNGCPNGTGFNSGGGSPNGPVGINMRDPSGNGAPGNFHGVMPPLNHRMMATGRMAVNFNNFNISPNIHVKASTPNTIQYMPVRPQNQNVNNIRVPPSLEFLQRYTNPQIGGGGGSGSNNIENPHLAQISANDPSKLTGPGGVNQLGVPGVGMNFFQHQQCNAMDHMAGLDQEQDMPGGGNGAAEGPGAANSSNSIHSGLNLANAPLMRAGARPMRHLGFNMPLGANMSNSLMGNGGPRMQAPLGAGGSHMMGGGPTQFSGSGSASDGMECSDAAAAAVLFGVNGGGPPQMYIQQQQQQKSLKGMSGALNMCSPSMVNINNAQIPNSSIMLGNKAHGSGCGPGTGSSTALLSAANGSNTIGGAVPGDNGSSGPGACGNNGGGVSNYKSFVGPTSNDLKYAQQYHSFQQQLYAISPRSQGGGGAGAAGMIGTNNVTGPTGNTANAAFFVNK